MLVRVPDPTRQKFSPIGLGVGEGVANAVPAVLASVRGSLQGGRFHRRGGSLPFGKSAAGASLPLSIETLICVACR